MPDKNNLYTIYDDKETGSVQISDSVLAVIAAIAATDVEGVTPAKGSIDKKQNSRSAIKSVEKSARVKIEGTKIQVQLLLNIKYGYSIAEVSRRVQEKVKDNLENMTGYTVESVQIRYGDVLIENTTSKSGNSVKSK